MDKRGLSSIRTCEGLGLPTGNAAPGGATSDVRGFVQLLGKQMEKPSSGHSYFKLCILHLLPRAQTCSQSCCLPKITQDFGRGFAHPCLAWPRLSQLLSCAGVPAGEGWMSPGGNRAVQVWPAWPKCHHAKRETVPSFSPLLGILHALLWLLQETSPARRRSQCGTKKCH